MKEFAKQLKRERELHSWSQEQLAEMLGTTAPNVSRWERGITLPSLYFRQKLTEVFGMTAEELGLLETVSNNAIQSPDQIVEEQTSAPPSPVAPSLIWNLPHQRNPNFTGREEHLLRLHRALHSDNTVALPKVQAISGLGGIGKTELATEYAYRYSDEYQVILWVYAETRDSLLSDLAAITGVLKLPETEQQDQYQAVEAVKRWLDQHTHWLLIVDNIEDFSLLREFLPLKTNGHIILTTYSQSTGPFVQRIALRKMAPDEGALLLLRRAKRIGPKDTFEHTTPADLTIATEISQLLGGLPLALDQAGAYIEEADCSLSHYLNLLQSHRATLLDLRNLSGGLNANHPLSVRATLSLSFERIKQTNPAAIDLLELCAFLHPDAIPEEMIIEGAHNLGPLLQDIVNNPTKYDAIIAELRRYSLIYRNPSTKSFTIHRLAQAVLRDSMDEALQRQWATRAVQVVSNVFPVVDQWITSSKCQQYLLQAQVCAALIEEWNIVSVEAGRLLTQLGCYLHEISEYELPQYVQAEQLLEKALAILKQILGEDHPEVAETMQILGWIYMMLSKYAQAEVCFRQALAIHERAPEPNYSSIAGCLSDLADIYEEQGRYATAELFLQRALAIAERLWGPEHINVAVTLRNLGTCYSDQKQYTRAEPLLRRSLEIFQKTLGTEHPLTAGTLNTLARFYLEQQQYAQAEPLLLQALEIRRKVLKPGHPYIASNLNTLARFYLEQQQYAQAEPLLLQALEIHLQTLGQKHPRTTPILSNLARLYCAKGEYNKAELFFKQAFEIHQQVLGPEQPQTLQSLHDLEEFYATYGQHITRPAGDQAESTDGP